MWSASNTAFATCSGLLFLKSFKYLASLQHSTKDEEGNSRNVFDKFDVEVSYHIGPVTSTNLSHACHIRFPILYPACSAQVSTFCLIQGE